MNSLNPEDELYIKLKYNVEIFENHHYAYFKYTPELYNFFEDKNYNVGKYVNHDEEIPSIGVFVDNRYLYPDKYNHLIELLLEFDRGELATT